MTGPAATSSYPGWLRISTRVWRGASGWSGRGWSRTSGIESSPPAFSAAHPRSQHGPSGRASLGRGCAAPVRESRGQTMDLGLLGKTAVVIARGLAETTTGTGVTVNSVLVGPTASEGVAQFFDGLAKQQAPPRPS